MLRSRVAPEAVSVIPNAVDTRSFYPTSVKPSTDELVIVVMSRYVRSLQDTVKYFAFDHLVSHKGSLHDDNSLVLRKGVDLLLKIIPQICQLHPRARFIIGGDGPKRILLEEMREREQVSSKC